MDRNESDPSKLDEILTFSDTEIVSEQASCGEGGATASNDVPQASALSPPKAISKEAVQKAMGEILPRFASMQLPSENTDAGSEYATCSEGGATASSNVSKSNAAPHLTKETVEKQLKEMFPDITSIKLLSEVNEESKIPPPRYIPIACRPISGGKPKSSRSIKKFLRSRVQQLKPLRDFMRKLNKFMTHVALDLLDIEKHDPNADISAYITEDFSEIFEKWENVRKFLSDAIPITKKMLDPDQNELSLTDIEKFFDCVSLLQVNLHDLAEICYDALNKYRSLCERFEDYLFLVHVNCLPRQSRDLLEQGALVLDSFGAYYNAAESEDSE